MAADAGWESSGWLFGYSGLDRRAILSNWPSALNDKLTSPDFYLGKVLSRRPYFTFKMQLND